MISWPAEPDRFIQPRQQDRFCLLGAQGPASDYSAYLKDSILSNSRHMPNKENHNPPGPGYKLGSPFGGKSKCRQGGQSKSNTRNYQKQLHGSTQPNKVLDVSDVRDDFYLNVLDWSPCGPLGVALDSRAYLYTPADTVELCRVFYGNYISSLKFCDLIVSIGHSDGNVGIYDLQTQAMVRLMSEHNKRVSALCFDSRNILYSGSKDRSILVNDLRVKQAVVNKLTAHRGEVCALVAQEGGMYMASGSNDNSVAIWDIRKNRHLRKYAEHRGAVKAIAWCPWKTGVVASAGGAGDKTIRLWNINEDADLCTKRTDTQISGLIWNEESGTLVSSHGFPGNQIVYWRPEQVSNRALSLESVRVLRGHSKRVLSMAASPSNSMICSLSADETLKFWDSIEYAEDPWQQKQKPKVSQWSLQLK